MSKILSLIFGIGKGSGHYSFHSLYRHFSVDNVAGSSQADLVHVLRRVGEGGGER